MRAPEPLIVSCLSCGVTAETYDGAHPDWAVTCGCCPVDHDHMGLGCRPVRITATAHLTLFDAGDLLDLAAAGQEPQPEQIPAVEEA